MDSSVHAFIVTQHIQDRMAVALATRTARAARRRDERRARRGRNIGAPSAYRVHAQAVER